MELILEREPSGANATLGKLWEVTEGPRGGVSRDFLCDTLEDRIREPKSWRPLDPVAPWKIPGETAIPASRYEITTSYSERFRRILPLVLKVPGFAGVRLHPGNTHEDTDGCILVGRRMGPGTVIESRMHFAAVFAKIQEEILAQRRVFIDIRNPE